MAFKAMCVDGLNTVYVGTRQIKLQTEFCLSRFAQLLLKTTNMTMYVKIFIVNVNIHRTTKRQRGTAAAAAADKEIPNHKTKSGVNLSALCSGKTNGEKRG